MKSFFLLITSLVIMAGCSNNNTSFFPPSSEDSDDLPEQFLDLSQIMVGGLDFVTENPLDFGVVNPSSRQKTMVITIKNPTVVAVSLSVTSPESSSGFSIKLNRCPLTIPPGSLCKLTLQFSSRGLFSGSASGNLLMSADANPLSIALSATVENQPNPNTLEPNLSYTMSPFSSGSGPTRELVVSNSGPGDANNLVVSPPAGYAIWSNRCPATLSAGKSCSVTIQYKDHRKSSPVSGNVSIFSSSPANPGGSTIIVSSLSGVVGGDVVVPPAVRMNLETQPTISSLQRNLDTTTGPISISIDGNNGNSMFIDPSAMMPNSFSVTVSCPPEMTGDSVSVYAVNDGADDALSDVSTTLADAGCNLGSFPANLGGLTNLTQRKIYHEPLIVLVARRVGGVITEVKVVDVPNIRLYNSPPKLHISSFITFNSSGDFMSPQYYSNSGSLVFEAPSILNPLHPELGWPWSWMSCSTNIGNCSLNDTTDTMGIGGVQKFTIRDFNGSCGGPNGVFDITFCANATSFCETSTISYQPPSCVCGSNQISDNNGGCTCDTAMGWVQDSTLTGCVMAQQCNIHTDHVSCINNNASNSNFPACSWNVNYQQMSCSDFDNQESSCQNQVGCSWDSGSGLCGGSYEIEMGGTCL